MFNFLMPMPISASFNPNLTPTSLIQSNINASPSMLCPTNPHAFHLNHLNLLIFDASGKAL